MALADAADGIAVEIEDLARWERDLMRDLAATRQKRERLTESLVILGNQLDPEPAKALRLRLNRIATSLAAGLREGSHLTDKVEAVHEYLASAEGPVAVRRLQRFLHEHGLAPNDHAAATILARKAKQGIVTRVARGQYRVNRHHPTIAALG